MRRQNIDILKRMLADCQLDEANGNITSKNFSILEPAEDTEQELVCLERDASTAEVEAEIERRGLVSGDLAGLLLYIRKNPNEQKKGPIMAIGSRWQDLDSVWYSPYAGICCGEFKLDLDRLEGNWRGYCRFLAHKRDPEAR